MVDYKDLEVWQKAFNLVIEAYAIIDKLPGDEKFIPADQIKRSSISIPSNIAEGRERQSTKEFVRFLYVALGSAAELETQLLLIEKLYSIDTKNIIKNLQSIKMMLNKLISSLKRKLKL